MSKPTKFGGSIGGNVIVEFAVPVMSVNMVQNGISGLSIPSVMTPPMSVGPAVALPSKKTGENMEAPVTLKVTSPPPVCVPPIVKSEQAWALTETLTAAIMMAMSASD